ncbi:YdeI/OmpD-associated family protein [Labrys monachus]|uniref:YdeI/OmpD-associated family protein n=1 Tax=Labrys monachus TaxID=217067 RepID=UPI0027D8637A|nr:YdeI/OmpD-associated family protein [Labrys monachus]
MAATKAGVPVAAFASGAEWEAWLAPQPATSPGVWIKFARKGSGIACVTRQEAIDAALCHGWIDGQLGRFDESHFLIRFTPRRPRSIWSAINRTRALALIEEGRMQPHGLAEIEGARADGRWEAAYASQSKAGIPDDLQAALDADEAATRFFATLDAANRYAILHRLHQAKKPETRARKLHDFIAMLGRGEMIHPAKKRL